MLARQLTRSVPRSSKALLRAPTAAVTRLACSSRVHASVPSSSALSALPVRSFSRTCTRFEQSALTAKLAEEINYEQDQAAEANNAEPEFLTEFKKHGIWEIIDEPGADEIILTRTFGQETIRLIFSISDIDAEAPAPELESEEQDYIEMGASPDAGSGGLGDEATDSPSDDDFAVQAAITITKPGGGALSIDAVAQDGIFTINNVTFYKDADVATSMSSEADWTRQGLYMGPAFVNLDEGVQNEFEAFLEERGIDSSLAVFVPELAEHKEQKEYVLWLHNVKEFLER
ncbi:BQ2448_5141 [Microbotryum intermedium]|uniref:BQ2448_5141 protein n=1 Tax=Microbotryum intermedium TaxID=269621 RepID=A0A238F078_9BASI|nr:BQ2448_5141 [Microbotryum intermedium]